MFTIWLCLVSLSSWYSLNCNGASACWSFHTVVASISSGFAVVVVVVSTGVAGVAVSVFVSGTTAVSVVLGGL